MPVDREEALRKAEKLLKQGKVADQVIGAVPKAQLKKKLDALA